MTIDRISILVAKRRELASKLSYWQAEYEKASRLTTEYTIQYTNLTRQIENENEKAIGQKGGA